MIDWSTKSKDFKDGYACALSGGDSSECPIPTNQPDRWDESHDDIDNDACPGSGPTVNTYSLEFYHGSRRFTINVDASDIVKLFYPGARVVWGGSGMKPLIKLWVQHICDSEDTSNPDNWHRVTPTQWIAEYKDRYVSIGVGINAIEAHRDFCRNNEI